MKSSKQETEGSKRWNQSTSNLLDPGLVRPDGAESNVSVSTSDYMNVGPGRFALPSMSILTKKFFSYVGKIPGIQTGKEYTKAEMASLLNLDRYWFSFQQYEYDDGSNDYASRTFIWNSSVFKLSDGVRFVVDPTTGERYIKNASVVPRYDENFDFDTSNWLFLLFKDYLLQNMGPLAMFENDLILPPLSLSGWFHASS